MKKAIIRGGLEVLAASGAHRFLRPLVGGVGVILTLHHVRPPRLDRFQPNRLLEITPSFLEDVIRYLQRRGVDLVSLDEMHRRLTERDFRRRFACFTLDDGYRDNREWAYPILKRYRVPFALYIPTSFPDHRGEMWWAGLEAVLASHSRMAFRLDGVDRYVQCATPQEKRAAYEDIYWTLRGLDSEEELRAVVRDLCTRYGVDLEAMCREECMTWAELAELAEDPRVTIGAHTVNHVMLRKCAESDARTEMRTSADLIEAALGKRPQHFAYPVGDPTSAGPREFKLALELGFKTAATTRPGVLFAAHRDHLTALPRISLNGEFQKLRYARVLLSGAATAVWNGFRRLDVA